MADQPDVLPPERIARRERIAELTQKSTDYYAQLQNIAETRDALIIEEMTAEPPAIARVLAELTGLSVGRIYKLRDNGLARQKAAAVATEGK